ncbi:GldG family protein [Myxococcota bacterium]|nr:GldG family protein [Myxococcota bacterium]
MKAYAGLLGALGLVGVVFGLLSFTFALFGAPTDLVWIGGNLAIGVLLLAISVGSSFETLRTRMRSAEGRRAGRYGSSALLSTFLSIAILGGIGYLANRHSVRFDWSEQKIHSLSGQSRKLLGDLDTDVQAVAFFSPIDAPVVRELLDRYAYESPRFQLVFADPATRPDLLEQYGIGPEKLTPGILVVSVGGESVEVAEVTEQNVTNAMVKLTRTDAKKVYFLVGHNERPIDGEPAEQKEGYGRAAQALRNENYQVEPLLLASKPDVPEDADVLVIAGATRPLLGVELESIDRYLERGGSVFVLIDPRANSNLAEVVSDWGVELGEDVVVDRSLALFGRATTPFASGYDTEHPITRELRETTLFSMVRSVRIDPNASGDFTELVFTGEESWAERDLVRFFSEGTAEFNADEDLGGPIAVAVVGTPVLSPSADAGNLGEMSESGESPDAPKPRVAVFGDADFADNEFIESYRDRDLFVNTVNWLLGDVESISIRPNLARASRFQLSNEQFQTIRSLSLFVLPEAIAILGVVTWWNRRRQQAG